ncbi:MAG: DUF2254 domain-containing protein [Candidatus Lambdaproteobacteria bacterium]|nr:DUF2254 domain-containing protein [Candidatus Lambdaproteobacteria bacterium]
MTPQGNLPARSGAEQRPRDSRFGEQPSSLLRHWVIPFGVLSGLSVVLFFVFRLWDWGEFGGEKSLLEALFLLDADQAADAIGGIKDVLNAIVPLVVTVVAIVVQLAAQRYTPKLVDLFIADRATIAYFALMVVATMYALLMVYARFDDLLPFWGTLVMLLLTGAVVGLLIPYINYVFLFLTPENIIRIIRRNAKTSMARMQQAKGRPGETRRYQRDVANAMEQISDIALSAVSQMDRNVALLSIRSLKDVMADHLLIKRRMPAVWYRPNKDYFPAASTDFLNEIHRTRTWVEAKGFMDMELIFKMSIKEMPDAVSAVANSTKIIGQYAIRLRDTLVLQAVIEFFNTFLRHALNDRNPKALYNLFYQYRLLAEEVLLVDQKLAERIAFYFKYYGQLAQTYNVPLILITACFDLSYLLKKGYQVQAPNLDALMTTFLEVDDNPATQSNEFDLRSVRKAQLAFAAFLLSQGDERLVQRIANDMKQEPRERMETIQREMLSVSDRKFWEVTDRGVNFFFLEDAEKEHLKDFYRRYIEPNYPPRDAKLQVAAPGR